jgi:hypothetical protein
MKQLFDNSWEHGWSSAAAILGGLALSALFAAVAAGPIGAIAVVIPLAMVVYSTIAYLRRTIDDREQLLSRVMVHEQLRRTYSTLVSLELARPLTPVRPRSSSSEPRPPVS